ncbi:uncharacterized protein LOC131843811 [Achroia grisella]|uniref:uncharacterized protein LOC131843811 n=1 Tax=Achroia grisella TaxID=688607 RepID=UPI0027D233AA|nr:uncharacterized protein LOC131843811 [Achroia grisella]
MGQLPAVRVNQHRPFINSGVDYAGPVLIKTSKGRGYHAVKGYICLFVCMATRAIHLEAVTDLTSQAFIAAFRRFVARRGHCLHIWSDNGTNFVGADKKLKELLRGTKIKTLGEVMKLLSNEGTTWHFIPPRMPTCGGLWESGVQTVKRHLNRVNKDVKLTYEELSTLLTQIEACLNSRPLCQIDNNTESPLIPGHFLIDEDLPPTKWLLGKIKYLHPGTDNLVRVVTIQCKGSHEMKRPLSKLVTALAGSGNDAADREQGGG